MAKKISEQHSEHQPQSIPSLATRREHAAIAERLRRSANLLNTLAFTIEMPEVKAEAAAQIAALDRKLRAVFGLSGVWASLWRSVKAAAQIPDSPLSRSALAEEMFLDTHPEWSAAIHQHRSQLELVVNAARQGPGRRMADAKGVVELFHQLAQRLEMQPPAVDTLKSELYRRRSRRR